MINFFKGLQFLPFLMLLLAWMLPDRIPPFTTAHQDFLAILAVLFIGLVYPVRLGFSRIALFFFAVALIPILQWCVGLIFFGGDAFVASAYLSVFGLALILVAGCSESETARDRFVTSLFTVLLVAGILSSWIILRQWLGISDGFWEAQVPTGGRPYGNLGQPNNMSTLLLMSIFGVLYFYEVGRLGRVGAGGVVAFLLLGVAITQSRTPWVVGILALTYWCVVSKSVRLRCSPRVFFSWLVLYFFYVVGLSWVSRELLLSHNDFFERAQSLERLGLWWQMIRAVINGPLWGYGWNQVSVAQVLETPFYPIPLMTEHSHNFAIDLFLWNGPLLGGVLVATIFAWLFRLSRSCRSIQSICCFVAACAVIVHGMLELPLEYAFLLVPTGLLLGVAAADVRPKTFFLPVRVRMGVFPFLVLGLFGVWSEYSQVEEDFRTVRLEAARIAPHDSQTLGDKKIFTQLEQLMLFTRTPAREGMSAEEVERMRKVALRYPYAPSLVRYATVLGLNGDFDGAKRQLGILHALYGNEIYLEAMHAISLSAERYPQLHRVVHKSI